MVACFLCVLELCLSAGTRAPSLNAPWGVYLCSVTGAVLRLGNEPMLPSGHPAGEAAGWLLSALSSLFMSFLAAVFGLSALQVLHGFG